MHFKAKQVLNIPNISILIPTNQGLFKSFQTRGGRTLNIKHDALRHLTHMRQCFAICTFHYKQHING